jgi:hypothetical protein
MKNLTKTIVINIETVAVPIRNTAEFVLVYRREVGHAKVEACVMKAVDYDSATSPDHIKNYEFVMPHFVGVKDSYKSKFILSSAAQVDAIKSGNHEWYKIDAAAAPPVLAFGEEISGDVEVIGYCYSDYTFCDINYNYINKTIIDTYLNRDYRINDIVKHELENPEVDVILENVRRNNYIYYVPGNGDTLRLGLRLSDENYAKYVGLAWYEKKKFLDEITILRHYKREEELEDEGEENNV